MKKYLIVMLFVVTACSSLKKSTTAETKQVMLPKYQPLEHFKGDTLQFVKNSILDRKQFYEGKELNVLLKDLQMPVKKYVYGSKSDNKNITPYIYIYIYNNTDMKIKKGIDPSVITIVFDTPLPRETTVMLSRNNTGWTSEVSEYYGKQIVGIVGKVIYNFK